MFNILQEVLAFVGAIAQVSSILQEVLTFVGVIARYLVYYRKSDMCRGYCTGV